MPSDEDVILDAEDLDLPENIFQDFDLDLDLDFEVDFGGDCITSCNQMENYVMHSEYEANRNYPTFEAPGARRKRSLPRQASAGLSFLSFLFGSFMSSIYKYYMHSV